MKIVFSFLMALLCFEVSYATDDRNSVAAILKTATVYRTGAELQHDASASLKFGNNELTIEGISSAVDVNSIQVNCPAAVTILGVEYSNNYLVPETNSPEVRKLLDSVEKLQLEKARNAVLIETTNELLSVLKANKEIKGSQTGLSVAELVKLMDYYKLKSNELQSELAALRARNAKLELLQGKLNAQVEQEKKKNVKVGGRIVLQLSVAVSGNYDFVISYVTQNAYWLPYYDMKADNIKSPVNIVYKARIAQTTGIDWKQVKLSLSTSTPSQFGNMPLLKSWFLAYIDPVVVMEKRTQRSVSTNAQIIGADQLNTIRQTNINNALAGKVAGIQLRSQSGYELDANTAIKLRGENGLATANAPIYVVNGTIMPNVNSINTDYIKDVSVLQGNQASALFGAQGSNGAIIITLKDGLEDYISIAENELDITYDISIPYDIPSNGKQQTATLKEDKADAIYKYYSVPKMDKDVFLLAAISNWQKLNLLPGEANIIFEGTYIGKTFIDPATTSDTLNLTLGKDKRIAVKKEKLRDFSSVKFLGSNKLQKFTYEMTVRNNKNEPMNITLKDQYPVSTNKDVVVDVDNVSDAENNTETGLLTWKFSLAPGETRKIRVSYDVKYPKGKVLNLE